MQIVLPEARYMSREGITPYEFIEKIGRICYKSEEKIANGTAEPFVRGLIKRQHWAMLEHSNVIVEVHAGLYYTLKKDFDTTYLRMTAETDYDGDMHYIISGSFRAWRDLFVKAGCDVDFLLLRLWRKFPLVFDGVAHTIYEDVILKDDQSDYSIGLLEFLDERDVKAMYFDNKEVVMQHVVQTIHFICDRGVTHEFVRHRPCGFAQESTRYCNYCKGQFGGEITVIEPLFFARPDGIDLPTDKWSERYGAWRHSCEVAEESYNRLIASGATPQKARTVLPNSLKTELVITACEAEWQHIVNLRYHGTTGAPHPQMKEAMALAVPHLAVNSNGRIE